jgi:hypothetical protein
MKMDLSYLLCGTNPLSLGAQQCFWTGILALSSTDWRAKVELTYLRLPGHSTKHFHVRR